MEKNIYQRITDYFLFARPFAFLGIAIIFICYSIIAIKIYPENTYSIKKIILGALSWGLLASAAHALNNIFDLEIDKVNKPFRVLPSKKISLKEAWLISIFIYTISAILSIMVSIRFFVLLAIGIILTLTYSFPFLRIKKRIFLANINIAIPRGILVILAGWYVIEDIFNIIPWFLGLISFFYLLGAITTKDIADIEGDKKNNCKTLPSVYGINKTATIIAPFLILPFFLILIGIFLDFIPTYALFLILLSLYGAYIVYLVKNKQKEFSAIEKNHISWKHSYILFMIYHIGLCICYLLK